MPTNEKRVAAMSKMRITIGRLGRICAEKKYMAIPRIIINWIKTRKMLVRYVEIIKMIFLVGVIKMI